MDIHKFKHEKRKSFRNKNTMQRFIKDIAIQRIEKLFHYARSVIKTNPDLSKKYILLARKIAMRARVHIPTKYKRLFCKKCNTILIPGFNSRVRLRQNRFPHVTITCLSCGSLIRYPLKLKRKKKKTSRTQSN